MLVGTLVWAGVAPAFTPSYLSLTVFSGLTVRNIQNLAFSKPSWYCSLCGRGKSDNGSSSYDGRWSPKDVDLGHGTFMHVESSGRSTFYSVR